MHGINFTFLVQSSKHQKLDTINQTGDASFHELQTPVHKNTRKRWQQPNHKRFHILAKGFWFNEGDSCEVESSHCETRDDIFIHHPRHFDNSSVTIQDFEIRKPKSDESESITIPNEESMELDSLPSSLQGQIIQIIPSGRSFCIGSDEDEDDENSISTLGSVTTSRMTDCPKETPLLSTNNLLSGFWDNTYQILLKETEINSSDEGKSE